MIMRITWGKLRAGTWQEYEQAYHATVAGKEVPGLRGRWLAQDVNDPDGGFSVSVWEHARCDMLSSDTDATSRGQTHCSSSTVGTF